MSSKTPPSSQDERVPLLFDDHDRPRAPTSSSSRPEPRCRKWSPFVILILAAIIIITVAAGDELINSPQTRVFESIFCRQYYEHANPALVDKDGNVPEVYCKVPSVQGQVAMLKGWQTFFDGIGSLLLAIPWGWFADSYGRKPLLQMIIVAFWLRPAWIQMVTYFWQTFPIRLVWLSALHSVLGGGSPVVSAVLFTIVTDVTPENDRAVAFFRLSAAQLFAQFVTPPISAALMERSPWIPLLLGLGIQLIPIGLGAMLPETLNYNSDPHYPSPTLDAEGGLPSRPTTPLSQTTTSTSPRKPCHGLISRALHALRTSTDWLTRDIRILILTPLFVVHMLIGSGIFPILLQYSSTRYSLRLSGATLVLSLRAGLVVIMLLIVLPWAQKAVQRHWGLSPLQKDLRLGRYSALLYALGLFGIGFSVSVPWLGVALVVFTLGSGVFLFLRSLLTSFVEKHHVARLYTLLGIIDVAGFMLGAPALAELFAKGMDFGGVWLGLPFFVCGASMVVTAMVLWCVRADEGRIQDGAGVEVEPQ